MADPLSQFDPVFQAAGTEWNVDPTLLKAVAAQESGGRTNAVSPAGAQGLMQITPATQKYLGITDPNDPVQSIYGAAKYLNEGLTKEGSPEGALLYYHGGPGWRQAYGPESQAYVPGVTRHYQAFQSQQPPAQAQAPQASPPSPSATPSQGPLIIGDSLASKGGLGGSGVVGASPGDVLDNINNLKPEDVNGRDVILSSGASNNPAQAGLVEDQIKALQNNGAKSINVVGVGNAPKLAGVNDALAATAGRFGANFVPLDTTQLSPGGVHPTQRGYRTLLAAATPKVTADAPTAPQGQGTQVASASDDLLSLLPPAPKPSTPAAPAAPAAQSGAPTPDDLLSMLPPAPKPSQASQQPTASDFADTGGGDQNLPGWMLQSPAGADATTLQGIQGGIQNLRAAIARGDTEALNALKPGADEPWYTRYPKYAAMMVEHPLAKAADLAAGVAEYPVDAMIGLGQGPGANALTIDPNTNAVRLTPEAGAASMLGANPLRFSGTPSAPPPPPYSPPSLPDLYQQQRPWQAPGDRQAPPTDPVTQNLITMLRNRQAATQSPAGASVSDLDIPQAPAPPTARPPVSAPVGPQPTGAQVTPPSAAGLTPGQAAAYGSTADKQWLFSSQQPGVTDTTEYYQGDIPTLAEREQTVNAARDQKTQRNISTEAAQAEREFLHDRSEARKEVFQEAAGSDATQYAAITEADKNISDGLARAWRAGGQVNPQGIMDAINAESQTSGGKLPPVRAAMRDVAAALQKDDGSGMETDPQAVYQVRRVINYLQSREGKQANPGYGSGDVQAALQRVKGAIDTAIEPAAPGFRQAIGDYANAQRAIEARELLQTEEPKLYDTLGNMNYVKFHNFMQRVITMRDPRMPPNPAQSLTLEQMNTLKGLHDSLKRSASASDLAKAYGSDTTQNLMDIARQAVSGVAGDLGAAAIGLMSHGPAGMIIGPMVKRGVGEFLTARGQRKATARMQELLRPDPTQYPTTPNPQGNYLQPPPSANPLGQAPSPP